MATPNLNITAIYTKSINEARASCSWPWAFDYAVPLPNTQLTVHQVFMIATGAASLFNILVCSYLLWGHLSNWTRPREQKQYVRVILFSVVLSVVCFLAVTYYHDTSQIEAVGELYECFAISALFLLYVQIVAPHENVSGALDQIRSKAGENMNRRFKVVLQILPVNIVLFIAYEAILGTTCPLSSHRKNGRTAITVISSISTVMAVVTIIAFERRMRDRLQGHRPLLKLASFKIVIGLQVLQNLAWTILNQHGSFIPSAPFYVSYNDLSLGLPQLILSWELLGMTMLFFWAYGFAQFRTNGGQASSPMRALVQILNLSDIFEALCYSFIGGRRQMANDADLNASYTKHDREEESD